MKAGGNGEVSIVDFLNDELPQFYTADLATIHGANMFSPHKGDPPVLDNRILEVVDWTAANVDITREFGAAGDGLISVHAYLDRELANSDAAVVYYDHGTGEIADFVVFKQDGMHLVIRLLHCKWPLTGAVPGHRLDDINEQYWTSG